MGAGKTLLVISTSGQEQGAQDEAEIEVGKKDTKRDRSVKSKELAHTSNDTLKQ